MKSPALLHLVGDDLLWVPDGDHPPERRPFTDEDASRLDDWTVRYREGRRDSEALTAVGREIFDWLDGAERWLHRALVGARPPWRVEFVTGLHPGARELLFLEAPWELLADEHGPLAGRPDIVFCPVRRLGNPVEPLEPSPYRLSVAFMAASPEGQPVLAFEEEEAAVLEATGGLALDLAVEESGNLQHLGHFLRDLDPPADVLHLSCHGRTGVKPVLLFEDELGNPEPVTAADLARKIVLNRLRLLFLSACETADPGAFLSSLAVDLIRLGAPAVLGWGGSVRDDDAIRFAAALYRRLTLHETLAEAVAHARLELFTPSGSDAGPSEDWHLARLVLACDGGGVLSAGQRRGRIPTVPAQKIFLDARRDRVPVAGPREFVGRRRELRTILRAFRDDSPGRPAGVLVHGMGRQGKSSLAARVAQRLPGHRHAVLHGRYDAVAVVQRVEEALGTVGREWAESYLDIVSENPAALYSAMIELLEGPCADERPLLLVIDDFEQALETDTSGLPEVRAEFVESVRSVIRAFRRAAGRSCLLLTSRFRFTLPDVQGGELADSLLPLPLPAMRDTEGYKQLWAKMRQIRAERALPDATRVHRIVAAARGNPGLQNLLFSLELQALEKGEAALAAMEAFIEEGREPNEEEVLEFLANLALERLLEVLSDDERELLRISTLFDVPVPVEVLTEVARIERLAVDGEFGERLFALGLWEAHIGLEGVPSMMVNALVRPRAGRLADDEAARLAAEAVGPLFAAWVGVAGRECLTVQAVELTHLALLAGDSETLVAIAADAVTGLETLFDYRGAAELGKASVRVLDERGAEVPVLLLRQAGEACVATGEMEPAWDFYRRAMSRLRDAVESGDNVDVRMFAFTLSSYARLLRHNGEVDQALRGFEEVDRWLQSGHAFRLERAINLRDIAHILFSQGELEKALALEEKILPVFRDIGDRREYAKSLQGIAHIYTVLNDNDKALRLLDEALSIVEERGDRKGHAMLLASMARIRHAQGKIDEALHLYKSSLEICEELGDVIGKADTLWLLSRIHLEKDDYPTAFKQLNESYTINVKSGRLMGISLVGFDLGQLLCQAGFVEQGRTILVQSCEGFQSLGQMHWVKRVNEILEKLDHQSGDR